MPKTKPAPAAAPEPAQAEEPEPAQEPAEQEPQRPPTSRICVKNLPKYVDDRRLREHFAARGEVTDAKVMRTRDGKSRCFGFVGFRTPADAEAAVKYFDRSFFDTMRLAVEFAYKAGTGAAPRAWSKYTEGTSAHKRLAAPEKTGANAQPLGAGADGAAAAAGKKGKKGKEPLPEEADPKLREFLSVMQPRSKQAIWANDDLTAPGSLAAAAAQQQQQQQRGKKAAGAAEDEEEGGSDDEYVDLPAAAADGTPSGSEGGSGSEDEEEEDEGSQEQQAGDGLARDAAVSDLDYLKGRVKANFDDDDDAWAAGAAAEAGGSSDEEEESEEYSGSGSEEEEEAAGRSDDEPAAAVRKPPAAAAGKQRGRRKAADAADAELDAIFGGGGSGSESDGEEAAEEEEEEAGASQGASNADADMADADEEEERQQAGAGQGPAAVVQAGDEASIADTGRLFVRNLPYTASEAELQELFEQYGSVSEVHLVLDRASKKSKGFALVQFADPQDAVKAHAELDGSIFQGRLIHILPGKRPPAPAEPEAEGEGEEGKSGKAGTSSYKEKKEAELKAGAGNRSAWNTLFMRADTVAEAVAAHFGVSKSELLDRESGDMAVRMALGETHVIAETKRALGEAGADVTKLEAAAAAGGKAAASKAVARSDSVLVIKNLPFSASLEELETLFGAVGPLGRLVLPPTRTLALVEYLEPQDARRAFKSLAYKRYQHVPLYLEWAPKAIFSSPPPPRSAPAAAAAASKPASGAAAAAAAPAAPAVAAGKGAKASKAKAGSVAAAAPEAELLTGLAEAQAEEAESSSIFVKNLAWGTEEAALRSHFDAAVSAAGGAVRAVKIAKKKGHDGKQLSAGFGFVECSSEAVAKAAVKALQGSALDGHKLVLQLSQKKPAASAAAAGGKRKAGLPDTSKMVVRNVAFEATRKDIMGLFTPFGQVKSCRLPRKFDGNHRGFAFVDFATKQEARNAMEAVQGAHLYGRRLVLEWAEEEGGLDELRAKTAAKYRGEAELEGAPAAAEPAPQRQKKRQKTKK
ncbi:Multiple RNA-binding domain-containing 1 [Chlorella sorokiniana]|uniref:Multiple RNA-binding domain-containing 1 n=1 Tax=Chlorella sorokiniana TaxID=3076 RepID=A0A2P6TVR1_CHLSO|nr:Multiple RNA-binding domain-containing 1 [Chlorella sorokiniana]|eukprot:PRW58148.1 Multiple RNA-binding domain-containing 1 [Chlorella sorokiniana]